MSIWACSEEHVLGGGQSWKVWDDLGAAVGEPEAADLAVWPRGQVEHGLLRAMEVEPRAGGVVAADSVLESGCPWCGARRRTLRPGMATTSTAKRSFAHACRRATTCSAPAASNWARAAISNGAACRASPAHDDEEAADGVSTARGRRGGDAVTRARGATAARPADRGRRRSGRRTCCRRREACCRPRSRCALVADVRRRTRRLDATSGARRRGRTRGSRCGPRTRRCRRRARAGLAAGRSADRVVQGPQQLAVDAWRASQRCAVAVTSSPVVTMSPSLATATARRAAAVRRCRSTRRVPRARGGPARATGSRRAPARRRWRSRQRASRGRRDRRARCRRSRRGREWVPLPVVQEDGPASSGSRLPSSQPSPRCRCWPLPAGSSGAAVVAVSSPWGAVAGRSWSPGDLGDARGRRRRGRRCRRRRRRCPMRHVGRYYAPMNMQTSRSSHGERGASGGEAGEHGEGRGAGSPGDDAGPAIRKRGRTGRSHSGRAVGRSGAETREDRAMRRFAIARIGAAVLPRPRDR